MTVAVSYIPTLLFGLGAIADAFRAVSYTHLTLPTIA